MDTAEKSAALAVAKQLGIPYASFANRILRLEGAEAEKLRRMIPRGYAHPLALVPLFIDHGTLAVALAEPGDPVILAELKTLSGLKIQAFAAERSEILALIERSYGAP